ncbi:Cgl0159 family (beta/alpha)8-fold protein [Nocardia gipuzkoensis]|uniref:Cgl0159 family (beta/alpha)8-fold protein n=1 Tax=Nocardia gipuzkoensis TaxID=2749991 RepID=UPI003EE42239
MTESTLTPPATITPPIRSYAELSEVRAADPAAIARAFEARKSRELVRGDGRLMIIAADHPARGALSASGDPHAMNDRKELLDRLVMALNRPGVDGVLGTADIIEDLLLFGALEDKVVFGSMNRGGLAGADFELDDRMTAYTAAAAAAAGLNGAKMLNRFDLTDPGTLSMMTASAAAIDELAAHGLVAMLEPFMSHRPGGPGAGVVNDLSPDAVIKSMHLAQGLGSTSAYTWLKLPVVEQMERVMDATTLPTLLLGGDPQTAPEATYARWAKALALPGVRGLVVGRALLYPRDGDVAGAVDTAVSLVR